MRRRLESSLYSIIVQAGQQNKNVARHRYFRGSTALLDGLKKHGFIYGFYIINGWATIYLKYDVYGVPLIKNITPLSTPSRPRFVKVIDLRKYIATGEQSFILTEHGVFSLYEAVKRNTGGRLLYRVN